MSAFESTREQDETVAALALTAGSVRVTPASAGTILATVTDDETREQERFRILEDGTHFRVPLGVST